MVTSFLFFVSSIVLASATVFTPAQDTQLYAVMDGETMDNLFMIPSHMIKSDLFSSFNASGRTVTVGHGISYTSGQADCFVQRLAPWATSDHFGDKLGGYISDLPIEKRNILNSVMMVANSGVWSTSNDVRKVIVMTSGRIPEFGDSVTAENVDMDSCQSLSAPPTKEQFKFYLARANIGLVFIVGSMYSNQDLYQAAVDFGSSAGLSDFIASKWTYSGGDDEPNFVDTFTPIFTADWIATTTTTVSPRQQIMNDIRKTIGCGF